MKKPTWRRQGWRHTTTTIWTKPLAPSARLVVYATFPGDGKTYTAKLTLGSADFLYRSGFKSPESAQAWLDKRARAFFEKMVHLL